MRIREGKGGIEEMGKKRKRKGSEEGDGEKKRENINGTNV